MNNFNFLRNFSIKIKIIAIILIVSFLVLSMGLVFFITWDIKSLKNDIQSNLILNAKLIGDYCVVPLTFDDNQLAAETLSRLKLLESVESGFLFDDKGILFASFPDTAKLSFNPEILNDQRVIFENGYFYIKEPVVFQEKVLGNIFIKANSKLLDIKKQNLIFTLLILIIVLILLSYFLAGRVQKIISVPIIHLKEQFSRITSGGDYSIRLTKNNNDEIGDLYDGFNEMIGQISIRERERDEAEKALKESETLYRYLFEQSPAPMLIYELGNLNLLAVNDAFVAQYGYSKSETLKLHLPDLYPEDEKEAITELSQKLQGRAYAGEWHHVKKDGQQIIIEAYSHSFSYDGRPSRIAVVNDITKRKLAEMKLRESERKLREAQDMAHLGHWLWDVKTGDVEWSEEVYKIFQVNPKEFTPHIDSILSFSPWPEENQRDQELINKAINSHEPGSYEQKFLHPDNSIGYYSSTFKGNYDEKGNLISVAGSVMDITERKKSEEEIRKLNTELEDRVAMRTAQLEGVNKELEAFSYSVSHDLRAPLRHTSGYVELLAKRCKSDLSEKGQHYLNSIADSVRQMGTLIDDLLQFSRTGRAEMRQSNSNMNEILRDVLESIKKDQSTQNIEWQINILPSVFCDYSLLKLVWMNLLSNAVKFSRKNAVPKIEIGVYEEEKEYKFFVRDNGVGFDMKYAPKLFGVFQRLHTTEEFEGTGIGLANVQRIIMRHGGRTWAEAELNKGATFYFTIPK